MKKVLIAMDYDRCAQKVAEAGFSLAKALGAEVILIHVISDPVYYSSTEFSPIMGFTGFMDKGFSEPNILNELKEASLEFLTKTKLHLGDPNIHILVKEGDLSESIIEAAKEMQADIIVMGSHSRRWLEAIVMGSVTESVLQQSTLPLFIIPTKKRP
jgi:nucleotide-binding universal stress UspA family protein